MVDDVYLYENLGVVFIYRVFVDFVVEIMF